MYLKVPILAVFTGLFSVMNMSIFQAVTELELASSSTMHFHIPNLLERRVVLLGYSYWGARWKKREQEHELKTTLGLNDLGKL